MDNFNFNYRAYEAAKILKSAIKNCSDALEKAKQPHLYQTSLWSINSALRNLTQAQMKLMQAHEEVLRKAHAKN